MRIIRKNGFCILFFLIIYSLTIINSLSFSQNGSSEILQFSYQSIQPDLISHQYSDVIDLSEFDILTFSDLFYLASINVSLDEYLDHAFLIKHGEGSTYNGFSIVVLDGFSFQPIVERFEILGSEYEYQDAVYFANFSGSLETDLVLTFQEEDLCQIGLLGTSDFDFFSFETICYEFNFVEDYNQDSKSDFIQLDNIGNLWAIDLSLTFEEKTKSEIEKSDIIPEDLAGEFNYIAPGFFNLDTTLDWLVTQNGISETNIYTLDGLTEEIIDMSVTIDVIHWVDIVDFDKNQLSDIIISYENLHQFAVMNNRLELLDYGNFQSNSNFDTYLIIEDINGDDFKDIFLSNSLSSFILSGETGEYFISSSINNEIKNSIPTYNSLEIGTISGENTFARFQSKEKYSLHSINYDTGMFIIYEENLMISNDDVFDDQLLSIKIKNLDLFADNDFDELSQFDEFLLGTDDNDADTDDDGLSDLDELNYRTNPIYNDTDYDLIPDNYEINNQLNPGVPDAHLDNDNDELSNYQEYKLGTDPNRWDTDDDTMPDGWEDDNGLEPIGTNDAWGDNDEDDLDNDKEFLLGTRADNPDTDGDNMTDGWEVEYGLDPTDASDVDKDPDNDGLANIDEFLLGLDPYNADFDEDDLPDGWEVEYGLDPKDASDVHKDLDKDFIDNKREYLLKTNPNGKYHQIIAYIILAMVFFLPVGLFITIKRFNQQARIEGFDSYLQKRTAKKRGFNSTEEFEIARNSGFETVSGKNFVKALGYDTVNHLLDHWKERKQKFEEFINRHKFSNLQYNPLIMKISNAKSISELNDLEHPLEEYSEKILEFSEKINQIIFEVRNLNDLIKQSKLNPFTDITLEVIEKFEMEYSQYYHQLTEVTNHFKNKMSKKQKWFKPWNALFSLINLTNDGQQVKIKEIAQIIDREEDHAEELIKLLLLDNKLIGNYDEASKTFSKGIDVDDYITHVMNEYGLID